MNSFNIFSILLIILLGLSFYKKTPRFNFLKSNLTEAERNEIKLQSAAQSWMFIIITMGIRLFFPYNDQYPQPEVYYILMGSVIYFTSYFILINKESY